MAEHSVSLQAVQEKAPKKKGWRIWPFVIALIVIGGCVGLIGSHWTSTPMRRPEGLAKHRKAVGWTMAGETPAEDVRVGLGTVWQALTRPYRVTASMLLLVCLVPLYVLIAERASGGVVHEPALPVDALLPLVPEWSLVYGALYLFLIVLPVVVIQQEDLIRRTVRAYLAVWAVAYGCFLVFPTVAPRPLDIGGEGFATWGLLFLYEADPPHNCFPSLHVAHSFVGALACHRVHRRLGLFALVCATLVALSTLFTRQHYVADVVAGLLLALGSCAFFFRGWARSSLADAHGRVAPYLALPVAGLVALAFAGFWAIYRWLPGFPW